MFPRDVRYQAAVIRDHHVLLVKVFDRSDSREFWIIPGGGREPGETEEECVCREVREETNLEVTAGPLLFETADIPDGIYGRLKTYLCTIVAGEASPGTEPEIDHDGITTIRALGWFDMRDPAGWDPQIADAQATLPLMQQLRQVLGYT